MCGIFGYVGESRNAAEAVLEGLRRLDYRGYDSWGVGVVEDGAIVIEKEVGVVSRDASHLPESSVGIGHTRWATHGKVNKVNAHPHYASDKSFVLAHNGIVENAREMKEKLTRNGYEFHTETDTEVIVRLIEKKRAQARSLPEAVRRAFKELGGRNTVIVLSNGGDIIAARNGSPLVIGIAKTGDVYFSSDVFSFAPHVKDILVIDNGQLVVCRDKGVALFDIGTGKKLKPTFEKNLLKDVSVDKGSFDHFMRKEIQEAPFVIRQVLATPEKSLLSLARAIKKARSVYCIGSGTAGGAAAQTAFYLREFGNIRATALIGAEAHEYRHLIGRGDLLIAPSQSGETADVLEVLEEAHAKGAQIASLVNMPGSMMTRLSDFAFMANAGPEICVMSTKVYASQIAWGYLIAKAVQGKLAEGKRNLKRLALGIETMLGDKTYLDDVRVIARSLAKEEHIFLLGKGQNLQIMKEGMVKMVEGAYTHAHAIAAGDLKHYAITLMEPGVRVITALSNDDVKADVLNAVHEVRARGASVLGIAPENSENFADFLRVPDFGEVSAIANVVPLQLLAYEMAVFLGNNVDKPRNIAKSVTVK